MEKRTREESGKDGQENEGGKGERPEESAGREKKQKVFSSFPSFPPVFPPHSPSPICSSLMLCPAKMPNDLSAIRASVRSRRWDCPQAASACLAV